MTVDTTPLRCVRCHREAPPPQESDASLYWEAVAAADRIVVCPECIAAGELHAMENEVRLAERARAEKVRENRLRRMAKRQGLILQKSRRRDGRALDYGTYALVRCEVYGTGCRVPSSSDQHWRSHELVAGDSSTGYGLSLDDVERCLTVSPVAARV